MGRMVISTTTFLTVSHLDFCCAHVSIIYQLIALIKFINNEGDYPIPGNSRPMIPSIPSRQAGLNIEDKHEELWHEAEMLQERYRRHRSADTEDNAVPLHERNLWRVKVQVRAFFFTALFVYMASCSKASRMNAWHSSSIKAIASISQILEFILVSGN